MRYRLVILAIPVLLFSACKDPHPEKKTRNNGSGKEPPEKETEKGENAPGYKISAPTGWEKKDTFYFGESITIIRSPSEDDQDDFRENINVVTEVTGNTGFEEITSKNIRQLERGLKDYKQEELSDRMINGLPFKCLRYSHKYNGFPIDVLACFTVRNRVAYFITCSAEKGRFSEWSADFETSLGSFKIY